MQTNTLLIPIALLLLATTTTSASATLRGGDGSHYNDSSGGTIIRGDMEEDLSYTPPRSLRESKQNIKPQLRKASKSSDSSSSSSKSSGKGGKGGKGSGWEEWYSDIPANARPNPKYFDKHGNLDCDRLTECHWPGMRPEAVGNGYCNREGCYNHEVCGFDGGDCCAHTCDVTTAADTNNNTDDDHSSTTASASAPLYACGSGGYQCKEVCAEKEVKICRVCFNGIRDEADPDQIMNAEPEPDVRRALRRLEELVDDTVVAEDENDDDFEQILNQIDLIQNNNNLTFIDELTMFSDDHESKFFINGKEYWPMTEDQCPHEEFNVTEGYCPLAMNQCHELLGSEYVNVTEYKSLSVGWQELDALTLNDNLSGWLTAQDWYLNICEPYEVRINVPLDSTLGGNITTCIDYVGFINEEFTAYPGLDVALGWPVANVQSCHDYEAQQNSITFFLEVQPVLPNFVGDEIAVSWRL